MVRVGGPKNTTRDSTRARASPGEVETVSFPTLKEKRVVFREERWRDQTETVEGLRNAFTVEDSLSFTGVEGHRRRDELRRNRGQGRSVKYG